MASDIFLCIKLFARTFPTLGIIISSITCFCLGIPVTLLGAPVIRRLAKLDEADANMQLQAQIEEISRLKKANSALEEKEIDYERRLKLLENITSNIETYQDVFKICFRNYHLRKTIKMRETYNQQDYSNALKKFLGRENKSFDEILSVMDCIITYQRGVDLQNICISKINQDTVVVSGISPEYTAPPRFEYKDFLNEIRHVKQDKDGEIKSISIENNRKTQALLFQKQNEYKAMFEDSFQDGQTNAEDTEEITKRAQDFIKIILQPVFTHVEFDNTASASDPVPLLKFLHTETALCRKLSERKNIQKTVNPEDLKEHSMQKTSKKKAKRNIPDSN